MLSSSALDYIVSNENIDVTEIPVVTQPVVETVVAPPIVVDEPASLGELVNNPVDSPSAAIPVAGVVVSTEPDVAVAEPVDIQMVVDQENPTDLIGQATHDCINVQSRADELLAMQHACESYGKLIRQTGLEGVSEEGAAFMQVGLRMIQKSLGVTPTVSNESIDNIHPRSSRVKVVISTEDIKEMATKAYEMFIAAIKQLVELIKKGWEKLVDFGLDQERNIEALKERLTKVKSTAIGADLVIRSPDLLFADGAQVFPEVKALSGLGHFALVAYPKAMTDYFTNLGKYAKFVSEMDEGHELGEDEINENLDGVAKPLEALSKAQGIGSLFNGNYKVDFAEDKLSFGIKHADGKEAPNEVELAVLPPIRIRKHLDEMRLVNKLLVDYRSANQKVVAAAEKVVSDVKGENNANLNTKVMQMVKAASPRNREIAAFVAKVTRAYLAVFAQMVELHEKSGKGSAKPEDTQDQ